MENTVYQFLYNSNVHESGWVTISLHRSKEGADQAMEDHKKNEYEKFLALEKDLIENDPVFYSKYPMIFGEDVNWTVQPIEIKP